MANPNASYPQQLQDGNEHQDINIPNEATPFPPRAPRALRNRVQSQPRPRPRHLPTSNLALNLIDGTPPLPKVLSMSARIHALARETEALHAFLFDADRLASHALLSPSRLVTAEKTLASVTDYKLLNVESHVKGLAREFARHEEEIQRLYPRMLDFRGCLEEAAGVIQGWPRNADRGRRLAHLVMVGEEVDLIIQRHKVVESEIHIERRWGVQGQGVE